MPRFGIHFWKQLPFLRLLIALCTGILLQYYLPVPPGLSAAISGMAFLLLLLLLRSKSALPFRFRWINGVLVSVLFTEMGSLLLYTHDNRNDTHCVTNLISDGVSVLLVGTSEPLTEKPRSVKTIAKAEAAWQNGRWIRASGSIMLYFKKDRPIDLPYGTQLLIRARLQPIRNSGNPAAFDYRAYCASQNIFYQAYLQEKDYRITGKKTGSILAEVLFETREKVLAALRKYIPGKKEAGVAEALLIGYRNDLDKELVQSYSNTGVVHIIAISGLHLGMIYGLLLFLFSPFKRQAWIRWIKPVTILLVLWGFCLLTGAAASILRSAVMFSFIVVGESLGRKTQVYNTLAASACCLLVYNPWFLWDVGFQLSYAAVTGILLFMKPICRLVYCRNKLLGGIWQLHAISLSAQVLTLPLLLYYFHQFPNLFLFTNFIAVPLSGLILYGELLLIALSWLPVAGVLIGQTLSFLIAQMNGVIERTDRLPFVVTDAIHADLATAVLVFFVITTAAVWLLHKRKDFALVSLAGLSAILCWRMCWQFRCGRQQKLIVYHIPKRSAVDIMLGQNCLFLHTIPAAERKAANSFYLKPARVLYGIGVGRVKNTVLKNRLIRLGRRSILLIGESIQVPKTAYRIPVDMILISGNPKLYLSQISAAFNCGQYVFDSSNPLWKIRYWKKEAESLHLRHHSVPDQGAFVMDL
ncbi:ComEC/Rec2 family competence protein [Sediminibacterium soli]|uniref:ComEC/Rec2 family competence protein n=1 Tax=Sediminibacterium soli TaxID=2698829 RepID=UPI00137A6B3E|nr:ComEC/Rec2 family competence protein [Sediminibacterium soli]NCI45373.1 ComEC family competence protein [Sediminibacterium soli]